MAQTSIARGAFIAATAATAAAAPTMIVAADLTPITIGLTPGDPAAVLFYASERGFFRNNGLDAKLQLLTSGPIVATAVTGRTLDLGAVNVGSLASARLRGLPLRIVAPAAIVTAGPSGDAMMVRADSPIRTGADFNGKTVAIVAIKTVQHAAFLAWVDKHGGDSKTIKSIEIPLPEMVAALDQSRVDAAIPVEPFTSQGIGAGNRNIGSFYEAMGLPFLVFAVAGNEHWLQNNVATALKAQTAIRQAAIWANGHQKECRQMLAPFMKIDQKVADTMLLRQFGTTINTPLIAPVIDVMVRYGFLDKPLAPAEMIWKPA
jgi:NitT/TauT family transport system substrate-binding protein